MTEKLSAFDLETFMSKLVDALPKLAGAVIIIALGFWVSSLIGKLLIKGLTRKGVDASIHSFLRSIVVWLLRFAVIMFTVKELIIYLAPNIAVLYAAELLQAFSFAIFVPASVRYVDEVIVKRNAVKGQAFVTTMITLGSIFASYIGGLLLDNSSPSFTLLTGVIVSAAGTLVMLFAIQKTK